MDNISPLNINSHKLITIAHRGASAEVPENTLAAFKRAIEIGVDLIELDVRFSRDKKVVIFHDRFLKRITDGRGRVEEYTLGELKKLDAGSWFSPRWSGEKIPTLNEAIQIVSGGRTGLYIEIKIDRGREEIRRELVERVLEIIAEGNSEERILLASFDQFCLPLSKEINPGLQTGLIFREEAVWERSRVDRFEDIDVLCARWNIVNASRVEQAHKFGCQVFAWTIDRNEQLQSVAASGVDGVASNDPAWLVRVVKK